MRRDGAHVEKHKQGTSATSIDLKGHPLQMPVDSLWLKGKGQKQGSRTNINQILVQGKRSFNQGLQKQNRMPHQLWKDSTPPGGMMSQGQKRIFHRGTKAGLCDS